MLAATVALLLGAGFVGGAQFLAGGREPSVATAQAAPPADSTSQTVHRLEDEVRTLRASLEASRSAPENARQDEAIRSLKKSVEALKQDLEATRTSTSGAVAQLGTKIEKLDRDPTPKLAELSSRIDQIKVDPLRDKLADLSAKVDQLKTDPARDRVAELTARIDRVERSVSSPVTTGSIPPKPIPLPVPAPPPAQAPQQPAAGAPPPKSLPRQTATLDGWLLRDVYDGVALVEGRSGLREVSPGQVVPGIGEVRSIERRGRSWVVVTSRGTIEADNRW